MRQPTELESTVALEISYTNCKYYITSTDIFLVLGIPTIVSLNFYVQSISEINEVSMVSPIDNRTKQSLLTLDYSFLLLLLYITYRPWPWRTTSG